MTYRISSKDGSSGIAEFIFGTLFICAILPCVWMNERNLVHKLKLIDKAREAVVTGDCPDNVKSENDYKLIHLSGKVLGGV